ncbi:MAG: hypothetical protein ACR2NL_09570 [Acidimicrobiia bacterium]
MSGRNRVVAGAWSMAVLMAFPASALADRGSDRGGSQPVDSAVVVDGSSARPADKVTDRPSGKPSDRVTDRPTDRRVDRCHELVTDQLRRDCITDKRPHDLNIRQLIYRLIHAGEWAKLVRLLHWLGWI